MRSPLAFRHVVMMSVLIAGFIAAARNIGTAGESLDTVQIGFLALGLPQITSKASCAICWRTREQSGDYAPAEHFLGGPKRIILMRHADKSGDEDDENLSAAGVERAKRLATYIPETFGKPDVIVATAPSKHSDRPMQTVEPLADALNLEVDDEFKNKEFPDLVDEIFNDPDFKNKTIVICWHHGNLPAMAAMLGAPTGSYPDPWPDDAFNIILDLRYDPFAGSPPKVSRVIEPF